MQKPFCKGDIVLSRMGHDKDRAYIVITDEKDGFTFVIDGKYRKKQNPKHKRAKHLKYLGKAEYLEETTDSGIRKLLKEIKGGGNG